MHAGLADPFNIRDHLEKLSTQLLLLVFTALPQLLEKRAPLSASEPGAIPVRRRHSTRKGESLLWLSVRRVERETNPHRIHELNFTHTAMEAL